MSLCHYQAQRATGATATALFVDFTSLHILKSPCVIDRHEERLELRHTLEGHQLGVVSVDINSTGNCILSLAHFGSDWSSLGRSAPTPSPPANSVIRFEYNVVRAAVYAFVHSHNVCDTGDPELSDRPLFCNRKINTAKDFRKALIFIYDSVLCAMASGAESLD